MTKATCVPSRTVPRRIIVASSGIVDAAIELDTQSVDVALEQAGYQRTSNWDNDSSAHVRRIL